MGDRLSGLLGAVGRTTAIANKAREQCKPGSARDLNVADPFEPVPPQLERWQLAKRKMDRHDGLCDYCDPRVKLCKLWPSEDGFMVSECQIAHRNVPVDNQEERRTFLQDKDGEKGKDHARTSMFTKEERFDFAVIAARDVLNAAMLQHQARLARLVEQGVKHEDLPKPPGPISDEDLETIRQRFSQTCGWFKFLQDDKPGQFALNPGEVESAKVAVRSACVQWAVDGVSQIDHTASPVFWAITMALEMVAQRETGFSVTTKELQQTVTMDGLHEYLHAFRGESYSTDEAHDKQSATIAKGKDARLAERDLNRAKRRKARADELGNTTAVRAQKVATLSQLIGRSGVWDGRVLSKPVRAMRTPVLVESDLPRHRLPLVCEVRPKPKGLTLFEQYVLTHPSSGGSSNALVPHAPTAQHGDGDNHADVFGDNELSSDGEDETAAGSEAEDETTTTASEFAESESDSDSELGEAPADLDEDDDIWEATQEETLAEAQSVDAPVIVQEPDGAPTLKQKRPYIPPARVKHATAQEIIRSSNFAKHGDKFYREWLTERRDFRNKCRERDEKQKAKAQAKIDKQNAKAEKRAAREAREAKKRAEAEEARSFNQLISQQANVERREADGGFAVVPNGERNPTKLTIREHSVKIRIGGDKGKEAIQMADGKAPVAPKNKGKAKAKVSPFSRCDVCNIRRLLPEGAPKLEPNAYFECAEVGKRCGIK